MLGHCPGGEEAQGPRGAALLACGRAARAARCPRDPPRLARRIPPRPAPPAPPTHPAAGAGPLLLGLRHVAPPPQLSQPGARGRGSLPLSLPRAPRGGGSGRLRDAAGGAEGGPGGSPRAAGGGSDPPGRGRCSRSCPDQPSAGPLRACAARLRAPAPARRGLGGAAGSGVP